MSVSVGLALEQCQRSDKQDLRVEDPAGSVTVGLVGLLGGLVPGVLNLGKKALGVLLGALLDFLAGGGQVV